MRCVEPDEVKDETKDEARTAPTVAPTVPSAPPERPRAATPKVPPLSKKKSLGASKKQLLKDAGSSTKSVGRFSEVSPLEEAKEEPDDGAIDGTFFGHWIGELITTETTLLQTFWIIQHVIRPAVLSRMAKRTDWTGQVRMRRATAYFENVAFLVNIHQEMLRRLVAARKEHPLDTVRGRRGAVDACVAILTQISGFFTTYRDYVVNFQGASEVFSMILGRRTNEDFVKFLTEDSRCKDLSFAALTMEPVQRLMRYQLFFEALGKAVETASSSEVASLIRDTVNAIKRVVQIVNNASDAVARQAKVYEIYKALDHPHGGVGDLVHPARRFVDSIPGVRLSYLDKKKNRDASNELVLLTDTVLIVSPCSSLARAALGRKKRAKFRLSILELECEAADDDARTLILSCDEDDACDCTHAHVRAPPTPLSFPIRVGLRDEEQRDVVLRKLLDMQSENRTRRNSFWNTPKPAAGEPPIRGYFAGRASDAAAETFLPPGAAAASSSDGGPAGLRSSSASGGSSSFKGATTTNAGGLGSGGDHASRLPVIEEPRHSECELGSGDIE